MGLFPSITVLMLSLAGDNQHPFYQHYQNLRVELYKTFDTLGLAVA